jgi:hypothetical protein
MVHNEEFTAKNAKNAKNAKERKGKRKNFASSRLCGEKRGVEPQRTRRTRRKKIKTLHLCVFAVRREEWNRKEWNRKERKGKKGKK